MSSDLSLALSIKRWSSWPPVGGDDAIRGSCPYYQRPGGVDGVPALSFVPLLQRRRLTPLAKAVTATAWPCLADSQNTDGQNIPMIFCSIHGETRNCFNILRALAQGQDLSPTEFSLSVHSAIGSQVSILSRNRAPYTVLAPGLEGYSAALLEADTTLAQGPAQNNSDTVLVVLYEQPLPRLFQPHATAPTDIMVLALCLSVGKKQGRELKLSRRPRRRNNQQTTPFELEKIRFALHHKRPRLELFRAKSVWLWELGP